MIELTDLNGTVFVLNCSMIESVKNIPETKVTLLNGNYYLVKETANEIVNKTIEYNRKIYTNLIRIK